MDDVPNPVSAGVPAAATPGRPGEIKARLLAAISAAGMDEVVAMLDRLWSLGEFRVQRGPRVGLLMTTVRDPFDTPFHLGEVLISVSEVVLDGHSGCGTICGDEPERALLLAAAEAAARSDHAAILDAIGEFVEGLEERHAEEMACSSKLAAATEVRFESMKKETVDFGSLGGCGGGTGAWKTAGIAPRKTIAAC
jgi:phosphonate C-P lyase system protein PhnG